MKSLLLAIAMAAVLAAAGCATKDPFLYLGVPEKEGKLISADAHNRTQVTPVRLSSFNRFETFQRAGMVSNVEVHDNYIYFTTTKTIPIANTYGTSTVPGSGGKVTILERYKTQMDESKLPR